MNRARSLFLLKFVVIIVVSYVAVALKPVDRAVVTPFSKGVTAASGVLLNAIGEPVERDGTMLRSATFAVDIKNGCNGLEAVLLLVAAILAFPAGWKQKLAGIVAGIALIEGINLVRVASLYILGRDYPHLFETFHVTIWQGVIFLLTIAMFVYWSSRFGRTPDPAIA
ncbi:MAG: exosortase H [Thermoanaerobaculia bacterium]